MVKFAYGGVCEFGCDGFCGTGKGAMWSGNEFWGRGKTGSKTLDK